MRFVRPIDWSAAQNRKDSGRMGHILYSGESCFIMASRMPAGVEGAPTHVHEADQIYYIVNGELEIELGDDTVHASAGDSVFIPAGLPHHNRNITNEEEVHLEIIAPSIQPGKPLATFVGDDPLPAHTGPPAVVNSPAPPVGEFIPMSWLMRRSHGSEHVGLYLADMAPGKDGPRTHIHDFDQFYFVVAGHLDVEVALERHTVPTNSLVVIPAGVPHRQWNDADQLETHLTILVPEPDFPSSPQRRWDTIVDFAVAETQLR